MTKDEGYGLFFHIHKCRCAGVGGVGSGLGSGNVSSAIPPETDRKWETAILRLDLSQLRFRIIVCLL